MLLLCYSDGEADCDDAWGGSQRDDLIRDLRLARCTVLDEETLEVIGSSRSAMAATLDAGRGAVARIEPAVPVAAPLEAESRRGMAPAVRAGAISGTPGRTGRFGHWVYLAAFLVAAIFGVKSMLPSHGMGPRVRQAATSWAAPATQGIETVHVGQRVLSRNPDSRGPERIGETAVDPVTWRHLTLRAVVHGNGDDEDRVEVETLQPPEWVEALHAFPGASVPLPFDLTEMGLPEELRAQVVANEPCAALQGGEGRVVLSTISHTSDCVGRLTVEDEQGRRESIRPTAFHKFYREPAGEWVTLENLCAGDRLRGAAGMLTVVAVSGQRSVDRVYNMTVEGEHVYYVSTLGVLAHNACKSKRPKVNSNLPKKVTKALPKGKMRTPAENDQARNFFERNREAAREWWSRRNGGKPYPKDAVHDSHPRALKDGGDPLRIEPSYDSPNAEHMIPRPEHGGLTDAQRWGKMGGRPPGQ